MVGRPAPRTAASRSATDQRLTILGLREGERVRWQELGAGRWQQGWVTRREADGSIGVVDDRGGARSLPVERVQVTRAGARGGRGWEPLSARAGRAEQLDLFG